MKTTISGLTTNTLITVNIEDPPVPMVSTRHGAWLFRPDQLCVTLTRTLEGPAWRVASWVLAGPVLDAKSQPTDQTAHWTETGETYPDHLTWVQRIVEHKVIPFLASR
jgi:hypothetical protein